MAKFRLDSIAQLSRQMEFAPHEVRMAQLAAAEDLLHLVRPARAYPLDFVIYKITDYRPREASVGGELLTGLALQHDLGLLIERVSATLNLVAGALAEPVLSIEDVCEKFSVTSKTIQRWRRRGLPARRFGFPDGKRRVGFLLSSVERFLSQHGEQVAAAANFTQVSEQEREEMLRRARRLAEECRCCVGEITRRIAVQMRRSPLTVLHTVRKHDQEHPESAIFANAAEAIAECDRANILKAFRRGIGIKALAGKLGRTRSAIYRVILDERAARLARRKVRFFDDPLYHDEDARRTIEALVRQEELAAVPRREDLRVPRDLPPYLQELYRTPLLTPGRERALFLKLNYHKYQFVLARKRLEPERLRHRRISVLEGLLSAAQEVKNQIVRANLRLVVSIARKHLRPGANLLELISDGNLVLMRAVDGFDVHRGHRFSTYATLALMKGFARSVPQTLAAARRETPASEALVSLPDSRPLRSTERMIDRDEIQQLLSRLDQRERSILEAHFGLEERSTGPATYEQMAGWLGLSKERVRQIEQNALSKLRAAAGVQSPA
jgi:RNA polymerase sigma factor (sigma-70 family)